MGLKTPLTKAGMKTSIADAPEQFTLFDTAIVPLTKTEVTERIDLGKFDGCHIEIDFTLGSLTDVLVIPEFADTNDNADYHQATLRDADTNGGSNLHEAMTSNRGGGKVNNPPGRVLWVTPNVAKGLDIVTVVGKATGTIWYAQF